MLTYLTALINNCISVIEFPDRYEVLLLDGSRRNATSEEISAAQAAWDAAEAQRIAAEADLADLKAQFNTDREKLAAIIAAPGGTNTARDAQILDMAQIMRRLLKAAKAQAL